MFLIRFDFKVGFVAASSVYLSTIGKDAEENLIQQYIPTAEIRTLTYERMFLIRFDFKVGFAD